jgi:hypothetical protein
MPIRFQADADLNQIIVTAIVRRFPEIDFKTATAAGHFTAFIRSTASPGLIIVPQSLGVREAADTLILTWAATEPDEWNNRIVYLPI